MEKIIKTNALFVISDYNWLPEDIENSWVTKYTDNYLILDRYHRFKESDKIKWQDNLGQNVYDIFDFIYKNYDNLPELTIFCRAAFLNPKDDGIVRYDENGRRLSTGNCSEETFKKICNNTEFTEIHDFGPDAHARYIGHPTPASKLDSDGFGFLEINNSWYLHSISPKYLTSLDGLFNEVFEDYQHTDYVRFAPGANYIIPKKNMLRFNKSFYERMREYIGWDVLTGEAHLFERAILTLFTSDYKIKSKYSFESKNYLSPIYLRNIPPPAETFDHVGFFRFFFSWLRPECYLELGVRDGRNFVSVSEFCKKTIGVDISPQTFSNESVKSEHFEYHKTTTDDFFNNLDKNILFDAVFIDADHSHGQSLKDFLNVKDYVVEDGFIFFHDTYPWDESYFDPGACNDVYKTALYIKQNLIDEFEIVTLPFNPGVTIVKKMKRNKQLIYLNV